MLPTSSFPLPKKGKVDSKYPDDADDITAFISDKHQSALFKAVWPTLCGYFYHADIVCNIFFMNKYMDFKIA